MTNYITYYTEESKFANIIETINVSLQEAPLSSTLFLKLDFDIWCTSQDKLFQILILILERDDLF